jgi:FkbM family methyltransferase
MFWLRELIDSNDVVYDVGANVGAYSLYAGHVVARKSGQVYAFEPAYSNFHSLCLNIIENNLQDTVMPYPIALSDKTKEGKFYLRSVIPGEALHALGKAESEGRSFSHQFRQGTISTSLDEFVLNPDVRFPNHIKIDVDGLEYEIIQGMSAVLRDPRLKAIMIEINSDISDGAIENIISESGLVEIMSEQWHGRNSYNKLFTRNFQPE